MRKIETKQFAELWIGQTTHAFPVHAHHGAHMSKPKPFCGPRSVETYKWMLALFCLVLALKIARLFLNDDDDDRPPDAAERSRSAFELVRQWRGTCAFFCLCVDRTVL